MYAKRLTTCRCGFPFSLVRKITKPTPSTVACGFAAFSHTQCNISNRPSSGHTPLRITGHSRNLAVSSYILCISLYIIAQSRRNYKSFLQFPRLICIEFYPNNSAEICSLFTAPASVSRHRAPHPPLTPDNRRWLICADPGRIPRGAPASSPPRSADRPSYIQTYPDR